MRRLKARRTFAITLLILVSVAYVWLDHALKTSFQPATQISGCLLFGLLIFLTFFTLPFIVRFHCLFYTEKHSSNRSDTFLNKGFILVMFFPPLLD